MRLVMPFAVMMLVLCHAHAQTGNSFVTADGLNRAPASVLHCATNGNVAAPCGVATQPLFVTGAGGIASATTQSSQLLSEQAIAGSIGTQSDGAITSGGGSAIAFLKGIAGALTGGVTGVPLNGAPTSRSLTIPAGQSTQVFSINAFRHYIAIQAPTSTAIWVNFVGGPASPNGTDCAQLSAGTLYESTQFVTRGVVNVYSPVAIGIAAWEG